jgi:hypothetical protein
MLYTANSNIVIVSSLSKEKQVELLSLFCHKITLFHRSIDFSNDDGIDCAKRVNNIIHRVSGRINDITRGEKWSSTASLFTSIDSDIAFDQYLGSHIYKLLSNSISDVMNGKGA